MQTLSNRDFKKEHFLTVCKETRRPAEGGVDRSMIDCGYKDPCWKYVPLTSSSNNNYLVVIPKYFPVLY